MESKFKDLWLSIDARGKWGYGSRQAPTLSASPFFYFKEQLGIAYFISLPQFPRLLEKAECFEQRESQELVFVAYNASSTGNGLGVSGVISVDPYLFVQDLVQIELIFLIAACMVLCFTLVTKTALITHNVLVIALPAWCRGLLHLPV